MTARRNTVSKQEAEEYIAMSRAEARAERIVKGETTFTEEALDILNSPASEALAQSEANVTPMPGVTLEETARRLGGENVRSKATPPSGKNVTTRTKAAAPKPKPTTKATASKPKAVAKTKAPVAKTKAERVTVERVPAAQVIALLDHLKITRSQLAQATGKSPSLISEWVGKGRGHLVARSGWKAIEASARSFAKGTK